MSMNDIKIISAIENNLSKGKFVIFPFGKWGKRVKLLLNKKYGIQEIAIVDNNLSKTSADILSIHDVKNIKDQNYVVLFAVADRDAYSDLLTQLAVFPENSVCDIASIECSSNYFSMCSDKMQIEDCNDEQLTAIFNRTRKTWSQLGSSQPYWSVLTDKKFLLENMDEKEKIEFYESGRGSCKAIIQTLIRNDVIKDKSAAKDLEIIEIGCGTGRVTKHLAQMFKKVTAIDVSKGNMEVAASVVQDMNVSFCLFEGIEDYNNLPKADIVYSIIVLQHNVPPVIKCILNAMLRALKPGGIAYFQVPTYQELYEFRFEEYMADSHLGKIEMHPLSQKSIFEIAYVNGCIPMEVYQDKLCSPDNYSCTFVMKKIHE